MEPETAIRSASARTMARELQKIVALPVIVRCFVVRAVIIARVRLAAASVTRSSYADDVFVVEFSAAALETFETPINLASQT